MPKGHIWGDKFCFLLVALRCQEGLVHKWVIAWVAKKTGTCSTVSAHRTWLIDVHLPSPTHSCYWTRVCCLLCCTPNADNAFVAERKGFITERQTRRCEKISQICLPEELPWGIFKDKGLRCLRVCRLNGMSWLDLGEKASVLLSKLVRSEIMPSHGTHVH